MNCNSYYLGALAKEVFLISDTVVENQELIIDSNIPSTTLSSAYRLKTLTTNITEETQRNGEKSEFVHEVSFKIWGLNRNTIDTVLSYRHFGFRTEQGQIYLLNQLLLYPTYDVELDENFNLTTTFHCAVNSNFPFVPVENITTINDLTVICSYEISNNLKMECNRKCYSKRFNDNIKTIDGEPFVPVDFLYGSVKYQERFDGKTITETLTFSQKVDSDMDYYNFIEYKPDNKWSFILTIGDTFIPIGFNNGLTPSYSIEDNTEDGNVSLTFTDKYDTGLKTDTYQTLTKTTATGDRWRYIKDKSIYFDKNEMQYVLQQKFDAFDNKKDEYKSFGDLAFDDYNIVGHFDDVVTYEDQYAQNPFYLDTNLTSMTFYKLNEEKTFYVSSNYDTWALSTTSSSMTISPDYGHANEYVIVTITNGIDPNEGEDDGLITINITDPSLENPEEQSWNFYVKKKPEEEIFPSGTSFSTDYKAQVVEIPFNCVITAVSGSNAYLDGNNIIVPLTENTSAMGKNKTITATTEYGEYTLHVQQNGALRQWVVDGSACDQKDLKQVLRLIIAGERTNQTKFGDIIEADCPDCMDFEIKNVVNGSYCDGSQAFTVIETRRSYDNWSTYEVVNKTLGSYLGACSMPARTYVWQLSNIEGEWQGSCCKMYQKMFYVNTLPGVYNECIPWVLSATADDTQPVVPCS